MRRGLLSASKMKEQSEAVAINIENTVGPHYEDLVDESSTTRSNQEIQEEPPKIPKVPEKNEGPAPIGNNNKGTRDLPPRLRDLLEEDESSTARSNQQPEGFKIPLVSDMFGDYEEANRCLRPSVVNIGPYAQGWGCWCDCEKLKLKLARQYCKNLAVHFYKRVEAVAGEAKKFYDTKFLDYYDEVYDDEKFTIMLFLDGCFILEFIMWLLGVKEYYDIGMNNDEIAKGKRDLFLLENQLPYIVLEALMEGHEEYELCKRKEIFKNLITICGRLPPAEQEFKNPLHLLDMMRTRFVKKSAAFPSQRRQVQDMIPSALLDKVPHCMGIRSSPKKRATPSATTDWYSYHSARVLNSMGIWFRPNKTGSFSDVKFESQLFIGGVLTLPPIRIDASTKSLLLNMLAFESRYTNLEEKQGVTSYMCFMDSLIDNADDVMILRSQNVIVNCLATDQEVADLFNNIARHLVPNPHTYAEAKLGIQEYCDSKFKIWMAECYTTHFKSPWTLLALCGAISVILLTAAQTYLAARSPEN